MKPAAATIAPINKPYKVTTSKIEQLEQWLADNYKLKKNLLSRHIENDGKVLDEYARNSIWRAAKKKFEKLQFEDINRVINSDFTPCYNPLHEYFEQDHPPVTGYIDQLADTLLSENYEITRRFVKKWLVSAIAAIYGNESRLMLIHTGKQRTGKTTWFRLLLPMDLKAYFGEISEGTKDNDLNIIMTQKWILLDDEFGAKTKKEESALKSLLSKKIFTLREPYGRSNVDLTRLACLCGTSNEDNLLSDPTGNTRYLPVLVLSINQSDYNAINKKSLWFEAYQLYKAGFNYNLTDEDADVLSECSKRFENYSLEYELINKYVQRPFTEHQNEELTATEIKNKLEVLSVQKLSLDKIGKELKRIGFEQVIKWRNGSTARIYAVSITSGLQQPVIKPVSTQTIDF